MATDKALQVAETEADRLRARLRSVHRSSAERSQKITTKAVIGVSGYGIGRYDLDEKLSIGGVGGRKVLAVLGFLAPEFVDADTARLADAVGDAALAIETYEMGREAAEDEGGGGGGGAGGGGGG